MRLSSCQRGTDPEPRKPMETTDLAITAIERELTGLDNDHPKRPALEAEYRRLRRELYAPKFFPLVILTSGTTIYSAKKMDDIINHLGGLPRCHASRTIYSATEPTFEEAEAVADFPDFEEFTAHINLV